MTTLKKEIDINCDLGESFGLYKFGSDPDIMPIISSANVACGFHAGDPQTIRETVALASSNGVRIGAHIGFPDRLGFGRREMKVSSEEILDYIIYQLGALDGFLKIYGVKMSHLKLHGALYMMAANQKEISDATIKAIKSYDSELEIYTLPNSELSKSAQLNNLKVIHEFFADRPYYNQKVKMFGWTMEEIGSSVDIAHRVLNELNYNSINEGKEQEIHSICVHSDTQNAPAIIHAVRKTLEENDFIIKALR
ncbi:5-oxoprolinase subunit PxpA [Terrilactibacillus laevilacticus]|uniref:5-oxoprolinase subunit PxpA n=1 Tax=Terrilactibacillus laevilacticus TaxID=1380157 RepID=UPI0011467368|nr:5-oxoprolinase subunit PxpA [Terrilactibacillus laevilacticus]